MPPHLRSVPAVMPPATAPAQQGWFWNGTSWVCDPDDDCRCQQPCPPSGFPFPPFPCPPPGFPTPCPPWFPPPAGQAPWFPGANGGVSFSSSPPANPVRGHFWWDGVMLHMFDGAAWVDIGPGSPATGGGGGTFVGTSPPSNPALGTTWWNGSAFQVWDGTRWNAVGPATAAGLTQITFAITATTARPLTTGVWSIIPFNDTPQVDTQGAWNPTTHTYTPTVAGVYEFLIRGVPVGIALLKNDPGTFSNAGLTSDIIVAISTQTAGWNAAAGLAQMNGTTDFVRMWGAPGAGNTFPATGGNPCFSAARLP